MFKRFWKWLTSWPKTYQLWRSGAKENCRNDLVQFADKFLPHHFDAVRENDQAALLKTLELASLRPGSLARIELRRGRGATTMSMASALWNAAYGHRSFPVLLSWSHHGSKHLVRSIDREIEANLQLRRFFPHLRARRLRSIRRGEITLDGRIRILCQPLLASLRGVRFTPLGRDSIRPDLIISDDAAHAQDAVEQANRKRVAELLSTFQTLGNASIVRIQTVDD